MFRGQLILPAVWQSLWTAFMSFGIMFGALCSGFLQDRFGRRCSYFVGGTATAIGKFQFSRQINMTKLTRAIGTSLAFTSPDMKALLSRRLAFFFAKTIIGFGMGILLTGTQTYVSEISPSRLRGVLLGLFPFIVVSFFSPKVLRKLSMSIVYRPDDCHHISLYQNFHHESLSYESK